jgi:trans-aconitate 2-methyltransferase
VTTTWDPALYLRFDDHRARPFHDLLARIGAAAPRHVVDAGCGPGHLTEVLARRWPDARVSAFDSSPEMVAAARGRGVDAEQRDAADWTPGGDVDVVVTNAVLQWVPGHLDLLRRWAGALPAGAWLALQVPGNLDAPSHALVRELAAEPVPPRRLGLRDATAVPGPDGYADVLAGAGAEVDAWETTYLHRLTGPDPVLGWISGTALRPVRDALAPAEYERFRAELAPRLRAAYPARADGTT